MSDAVEQYADRMAEALAAGEGLVIDERDPEIPVPLRDLWGFYRAVAVERPWIVRGLALAEIGGAVLLWRRRRRVGLARVTAALLLVDAAGNLFTQTYLARHTDEKGRLVIPPRADRGD